MTENDKGPGFARARIDGDGNREPDHSRGERIDVNQIVVGSGEMGMLVRSMDWSKTPLGPIEMWPQSLRTSVGLCLASNFPIAIAWGPHHVQIYNDGYLPICGPKHPNSMGQDFRQCWASAWPAIGEAYERALTGQATFLENQRIFVDRKGYLEESFFTLSFSPIRDESGAVGGLFHPLTEVTSRLLSERRTRALRDVAARVGKAFTVDEVLVLATETLHEYELDLPFVVIYTIDEAAPHARLVARYGVESGTAGAPAEIDLEDDTPPSWDLGEVVRRRATVHVEAPEARLGPVFDGPYPEPPKAAVMLPITLAGSERPAAVIVAGVSPRLELDETYRSFYDLLATTITTAVANARAYEEERRRAEAIAEIDRAKTVFFSNVSHEFRTPLTLMLGPTEDALSRPDGLMSRADLEILHRNELRLLKLVNALLDFSRIEAGRVLASYQATDLATLTMDLVSSFRAAIERAGLRLEVSCPPLSEPVFVDRGMWEKVVLNLLSNALKFTFEGTIAVALCETDGAVELTVRDTGTGIPKPELPHLFERFHRVEGARARTHEGSGIGLALVYELIKLHGGQVTVASTLGQGSTFSVKVRRGRSHLPEASLQATSSPRSLTDSSVAPYVEEALRWLPRDAEARSSDANGHIADEGDKTRGARLLVVDDNADMREYLVRTLSQRWSVDAAPNGKIALEIARQTRPALIITDIMMPELDGFGLLREVRADSTISRTPVIMLSARAGDEARIEGLEAGADDYLVKPFSARELLARVGTHLQLGQLQATADLNRAKLSDLFTNAPAGVALVAGPTHVFELANERYLELVSRQADILGRTVREVFPELEGQGFFELLEQVYRTGEPFIANEAKILLERDGSGRLDEAFLNFVYQPYSDAHGKTIGISAFAFDVTDQVVARQAVESAHRATELQRALAEKAQAQAESANRSKDEFMAMLGHELRNPLSPILTALELMRLRNDTSVLKERAVIERQARHLARLVDDLLDVSRIAQGKVVLKREHHEFASLISQSIEIAAPLLEERRHELVTKIPVRGFLVDGDEQRLVQVFSNLLTNAAKYTDAGGRIVIEVKQDGPSIVLSIADTGRGISAEMLPHVFDLFAQEHQNLDRSQGGLGLGLAIVKSLVALHGGEVGVESAGLGHGSRFSVRLPASQKDPDVVLAVAPQHAISVKPPVEAQQRMNVLLVDDNEDAVMMLAEALQLMGYATDVAHDGAAALSHAKTGAAPAVALLDIGLPAMDGYELARRLRELPGWERVHMIAVTGYGQQTDRQQSKDAGFDEHFVKPISLPILRDCLALISRA